MAPARWRSISRAWASARRAIELRRSEVVWEQVKRKSGRTGQVHPIGGFTGEAEYAGDLAEFLPWLRAARWVGVGRQTVWGKGDVRVTVGNATTVYRNLSEQQARSSPA